MNECGSVMRVHLVSICMCSKVSTSNATNFKINPGHLIFAFFREYLPLVFFFLVSLILPHYTCFSRLSSKPKTWPLFFFPSQFDLGAFIPRQFFLVLLLVVVVVVVVVYPQSSSQTFMLALIGLSL